MGLRSLRHKIFAFVLTLLVVGAGLVMLITERDVTRTLTTSEERAVDNVLNLLARDSVARWSALLGQKAATARQARQPLIQYGSIIESVLSLHVQQAASGLLHPEEARRRALAWVDGLELGGKRVALILDNKLNVLADSSHILSGLDLSQLHDLKGRPFTEIAWRELGAGDYSFVIFRSQSGSGTAGNSANEHADLQYAAWTPFPPWDWIIAVSDSAQHIVDQFEMQRESMEAAVMETLASIELAGSGFVFIVDERGLAVTPLPDEHAGFLMRRDRLQNARTLSSLLIPGMQPGDGLRFRFRPETTNSSHAGAWLIKTAFVKPLKWTIVAAVPERALAAPATELRDRLGLIFLIGLLAALALAWILAARITHPLQQLGNFARRLPERDLTRDESLPPDIALLPQRYRDEVGDLAAAFIHMDAELREKVATLLRETSRRERYESELNIGREIQRGLLPDAKPVEIRDHFDLHATMVPAKEVGGDLYDYFMLPDGRLCLAIGDVSDKGVPAALFMAVTRTLLRACAEDATDPAQLMTRVNTRLAQNNPSLMFVTLVIGILDLGNGRLDWANGGHPPPCLLEPGEGLRLLEGRSGPACGVAQDAVYRNFSTRLMPGTTLVAYTDGITEAMNALDQAFGDDRLMQSLADIGAGHPGSAALAGELMAAVNHFVQDNAQSDDITLLVLKRMES
ncbi:MAG: SpoIIE family protein phosphatase [Castellaniella sp.]